MKHKTQLFLAVAVSAAGIAFGATRQESNWDQPKFATSDIIVERDDRAVVERAELKKPEREAMQAEINPATVSARTIEVTESTFSSLVLNSDKPVLVDFGAEWCGACRLLEPVIHELANELGGQAIVTQVDVDANPRLAAHYGIQALPTLLVIKNGEVVDKVVGVASKAELRDKIDSQTDEHATLL
jgi:thioredoxin 1